MKRFLLCCVALALCCLPGHPAESSWTDALSAGLDKVTGLFGSGEPAPLTKSEDALPDYLASGWGKLTDTLAEALDLRDKQEKLPNSAWFGEDKESNARKLNKLLDAALEILTQGQAGQTRREAAELSSRLAGLRLEADKLRNQRVTAPSDSMLPWKQTRAKVDSRLAELDQEIQAGEAALAALNGRLAEDLREYGLTLDDAQLEVLLGSVTGDDLLQNAVIFANVKAVVEKLGSLAQEDSNDLEIARRYTGMYVVLNDLLIHTQEELARKIDGEYKPRLAGIVKEAEELQGEAQAKGRRKDYTEAQRKAFAANAESNAMTARVGRLYAQLLDAQRKGILEGLQGLRRNRDVADHTYRTVKSSGDLRNLIRSGLSLFDSIQALDLPQLQPLMNEIASGAMRHEFEELNRRMKQ